MTLPGSGHTDRQGKRCPDPSSGLARFQAQFDASSSEKPATGLPSVLRPLVVTAKPASRGGCWGLSFRQWTYFLHFLLYSGPSQASPLTFLLNSRGTGGGGRGGH